MPGRSMGPLARALEDFFTSRRLALPTNQADQLAAGRRQRRVNDVPEPLRPAVASFADSMLRARNAPAGREPDPAATTPSKPGWPSCAISPAS